MARLTAAQRKKMPASTFAGPKKSFPLNDANHVRAAKSLERYAAPATKAKINAKAKAMGIGQPPKKKGKTK
jgi:hypothetical protein